MYFLSDIRQKQGKAHDYSMESSLKINLRKVCGCQLVEVFHKGSPCYFILSADENAVKLLPIQAGVGLTGYTEWELRR